MQEKHQMGRLLSAQEVQNVLGVDKSTVYRMAADGRLPAIKVGRQWRFPGDRLDQVLGAPTRPPTTVPAEAAEAVIEVAASLLGVMMVVTDMEGRPLTPVVNPAPAFSARLTDPGFVSECVAEWRDFSQAADLELRFRPSRHGFECARTFVRSGPEMVAMVFAGGVAPAGVSSEGLYELSDDERARVLTGLTAAARALSHLAGHASPETLERVEIHPRSER